MFFANDRNFLDKFSVFLFDLLNVERLFIVLGLDIEFVFLQSFELDPHRFNFLLKNQELLLNFHQIIQLHH
jgi:hypothetical protein